jgi:hypothetical protein
MEAALGQCTNITMLCGLHGAWNGKRDRFFFFWEWFFE